jgi:low affinity Fe/Cu permease
MRQLSRESGSAGASGHRNTRRTAHHFAHLATQVAKFTGRSGTFVCALAIIALWGLSGPYFGFSDTWQLVINTGTTIITFLIVFLIQNSQYRDNIAIQTKLDELIRSSKAQNAFVGIEHLTDDELDQIRAKCEARAAKERRAATR